MSIVSKDLNNREYSSEARLARTYGVNPKTFNLRKRSGYSLEMCLTPYNNPFNDGKEYFEYAGVKYNSLRDCCKKLNIPYTTVFNRININHMTPKQALDKTMYKRKVANN